MKTIISSTIRVLEGIHAVLSPDDQIERIDHAKYRAVYYPKTSTK